MKVIPYRTESAMIKHIFSELLPIIANKYKLTKKEKKEIKKVENMISNKIRESNKKNG